MGIAANNPAFLRGAMDIAAAEKEARLIRLCDAYNVPLIFLADTPGYISDFEEEKKGLLRHGAMQVFAVCEATVPKITLYIGKCYGESSLAMCTRQMGGDLVLAWPGAQLGPVEPERAVDMIFGKEIESAEKPDELRERRRRELIESHYPSPFHAASITLTVDDIIDPRDTRPTLIAALEMAAGKESAGGPWKKQGNIPL